MGLSSQRSTSSLQAVATAGPTTTAAPVGGKDHPLTPLSAAEIAAAVSVLKASAGFTATTRIVSVMLSEPSKAAVYDGVQVRTDTFTAPRARLVWREELFP